MYSLSLRQQQPVAGDGEDRYLRLLSVKLEYEQCLLRTASAAFLGVPPILVLVLAARPGYMWQLMWSG